MAPTIFTALVGEAAPEAEAPAAEGAAAEAPAAAEAAAEAPAAPAADAEIMELLGQIFDLFDPDKSGHIEEKEGLAIAHHMGVPSMKKQEHWQDMLSKMDTDKDGKISKQEFENYYIEMKIAKDSLAGMKNDVRAKMMAPRRPAPSLRSVRE